MISSSTISATLFTLAFLLGLPIAYLTKRRARPISLTTLIGHAAVRLITEIYRTAWDFVRRMRLRPLWMLDDLQLTD